METVSIQLPAQLFAAIYQRFGEETSSVINKCLYQLVIGEERISQHGLDASTNPNKRPGAGTITGRVWDIADQIQQKSGNAEREEVIKACMEEGININTASTQFSYWKKANP
jgi:hypothetical protein